MGEETDRYRVPGLLRGLSVLHCFTPATPSLRLTDIARRLGISRSAAFRAVYTLSDAGYLLQEGTSGHYVLGPAVLGLSRGYVATREIVEVARPVLEDLHAEVEWSVHMAVLDATSILYLLRLPGPGAETGLVHVGSRLPAHGTTMGRVLLADLSSDDIAARYRGRLDGASGTLNLGDIRKQAATDRDEPMIAQLGTFEAGIASLAAPVRDLTGRAVAAISLVSAMRPDIETEARGRVRDALLAAADRISLLLGHGTATAGLDDRGGTRANRETG